METKNSPEGSFLKKYYGKWILKEDWNNNLSLFRAWLEKKSNVSKKKTYLVEIMPFV